MKCINCGKDTGEDVMLPSGTLVKAPELCDECTELRRASEQARLLAEYGRDLFETTCPALYRTSDEKRFIAPFKRILDTWAYGAIGVGLFGPPGTGKTRVAAALLKKHMMLGKSGLFCPATRFNELASLQFSDEHREKAIAELDLMKSVDILLIDDIGKGKTTERAEMELYAVLEARTSSMKPTLWTANASGAYLLRSMSEDRGAAILRRLVEFSTVVSSNDK